MKLSTILKSYLSSTLFRRTLIATSLVWMAVQAPILYFGYHYSISRQLGEQSARQRTNEQVYVRLLESISRFGDLVSARGQVSDLGKNAGLSQVIICDDGEEILGKLGENRCGLDPAGAHTHQMTFAEKNLSVVFAWDPQATVISNEILATWVWGSMTTFIVLLFGTLITYILIDRRLGAFSKTVAETGPDQGLILETNDLPEMNAVVHTLNSMRDKVKALHRIEIDNVSLKVAAELSRQVAHDIRSPLTALNLVVTTLHNVSEDRKNLIQSAVRQINQIANDLLQKGGEGARSEAFVLLPVLESVLGQKRLQLAEGVQLTLHSEMPATTTLPFSEADLRRVLSNLLDNALEALVDGKGAVTVMARASAGKISIAIVDNGRGIPEDILGKLGEKGFSYGKDRGHSGFGLGLAHARQKLSEWGGSLHISSKVGSGTTVELRLP